MSFRKIELSPVLELCSCILIFHDSARKWDATMRSLRALGDGESLGVEPSLSECTLMSGWIDQALSLPLPLSSQLKENQTMTRKAVQAATCYTDLPLLENTKVRTSEVRVLG